MSPVEKRKHSELKDQTPPARILPVQRIRDEALIQTDVHIGEEEEADINEEAEQASVESFARTLGKFLLPDD